MLGWTIYCVIAGFSAVSIYQVIWQGKGSWVRLLLIFSSLLALAFAVRACVPILFETMVDKAIESQGE